MDPKTLHENIANYYEFIIQVLNESIISKKMIIEQGLSKLPTKEEEKEEIKKALLNYIELLESAINTTNFLSKGLKETIKNLVIFLKLNIFLNLFLNALNRTTH